MEKVRNIFKRYGIWFAIIMIKKILLIIISITLFSCGFKPIHKLSDSNTVSGNYSVELLNEPSREIIEEINLTFISVDNEVYQVLLEVDEDLSPLLINTNGTVAKYRIEITISYELIFKSNSEVLADGVVRGVTQYDVGTSEINNEEARKSMTRTATQNALQILVSKIQSSISQVNDN